MKFRIPAPYTNHHPTLHRLRGAHTLSPLPVSGMCRRGDCRQFNCPRERTLSIAAFCRGLLWRDQPEGGRNVLKSVGPKEKVKSGRKKESEVYRARAGASVLMSKANAVKNALASTILADWLKSLPISRWNVSHVWSQGELVSTYIPIREIIIFLSRPCALGRRSRPTRGSSHVTNWNAIHG